MTDRFDPRRHLNEAKILDVQKLYLDDQLSVSVIAEKLRLTQSQVRDIRELRMQGITQRSIACRFGVNRKTIQAILNGSIWRHVS